MFWLVHKTVNTSSSRICLHYWRSVAAVLWYSASFLLYWGFSPSIPLVCMDLLSSVLWAAWQIPCLSSNSLYSKKDFVSGLYGRGKRVPLFLNFSERYRHHFSSSLSKVVFTHPRSHNYSVQWWHTCINESLRVKHIISSTLFFRGHFKHSWKPSDEVHLCSNVQYNFSYNSYFRNKFPSCGYNSYNKVAFPFHPSRKTF